MPSVNKSLISKEAGEWDWKNRILQMEKKVGTGTGCSLLVWDVLEKKNILERICVLLRTTDYMFVFLINFS